MARKPAAKFPAAQPPAAPAGNQPGHPEAAVAHKAAAVSTPTPAADLPPLPQAGEGRGEGITHLMVTCQREGFRRAGVAWTTLKRVVKVGDFTPEQIAALKAEPMLTVVEMTAADYQALIDELAS